MSKKLITLTSVLLVLFLSLTITSLAWFSSSYQFTPDASGSAVTGYFAGGDGTKEHPYQINSPIHVYNLAWLQYIGYLNEEEDGVITQLYFEIIEPVKEPGEEQDGKIDMEGIVLPPIGTTANPFVGHFNGNGYCISNLTVSNYLDGENDELKIVERPLSVTDISEAVVSVVGFFGVVGDIDGRLEGKLNDDSEIEVIGEKVNAVHDLYLENLTIRTETAESLVGLVAGYANGSIINVGVSGESELQLGSKFEDGLTVEDVFDMQYVASAYSLIGKYNADNIVWEDIPTSGDGGEEVGGAGIGWGSSINMKQLRDRITYIVGAVDTTKDSYGMHRVDAYGYNGAFDADQRNYFTGESITAVTPLLKGTVMPLSVDQTIFVEPIDGPYQDNFGNTLKTLPYYLNNKGDNVKNAVEAVIQGNSGYIVGGGMRDRPSQTAYQTQYIEFKNEYISGVSTARNQKAGISKSIGTSLGGTTAFPANRLHMLTIDVYGNTYAIADDYNMNADTWIGNNYTGDKIKTYTALGLKKYQTGVGESDKGVRNAFINSYAGETVLRGIKFNAKINLGENLDSIANLDTTLANNITLFSSKTPYNNYEMIDGAINFSLAESGIATTVVGTYANCGRYKTLTIDDINNVINQGTGASQKPILHSLFRIFQVVRNENYQITACIPINTVHEAYGVNGKFIEYVYNLADVGETSGYTYNLVFDYAMMGTMSEVGAAYYYEIPLNAGDYAIGATTQDAETNTDDCFKSSAFLLYLDIGANGDKTTGDDGGEGVTESMHTIYGVTFIPEYDRADALSAIDGEEVLSDRYTVITFELKLTDTSNDHSGLSVKYERTQTEMIWTETDSSGAFKVTPLKDKEDPTTLSPPS